MSKREPSIHITETNLRKILREFYDYEDSADDMIEDLVPFLMNKAYKLSLEKRSLIITNQTVANKVYNKVTNDKTDISLLANIIYSVRRKLKHKGIKPIDNTSPEWVQLKKLTPLINEYCESFNLSKREGYIDYTTRGLSKISSFRGYITKLYDMTESISLEREAWEYIENDTEPKLTKFIYDYYIQKINTVTGIPINLLDNPLKYSKFVEVRELLTSKKIKPEEYIDSQFEQLKWTSNYPEPEQLINDKSWERYNKYMYNKTSHKLGDIKEGKKNNDLVDVLKNIKKR